MEESCPACTRNLGSNPLECSECLKYINWVRLIADPFPVQLDANTIQRETVGRVNKFQDIYQLDMDQLFLWGKKMEAIAAACSMLYQAKVIKERTPDIDRAEMTKAIEKSNRIQKLENLPKKEKKILSERDKAVAAIFNIYKKIMNEEIAQTKAEAEVDARMAEVGRKVTVS